MVLWGGSSDKRRSHRPAETLSIWFLGSRWCRGPMLSADNFCLSEPAVSVWLTSLTYLKWLQFKILLNAKQTLWLVFRFACCAIGLSLQCLPLQKLNVFKCISPVGVLNNVLKIGVFCASTLIF